MGTRLDHSVEPMIALSATNPCHLYDLAVALHARGQLGAYHSGYPQWRLRPPDTFPLRAHSARTLVTYGLLRLPMSLRPAPHRLFRWQDTGFDRATARHLVRSDGDSVHAMPGQALATFRRAKELGMTTVLNHATGPVRQQLALIEEEFRRAGLEPSQHHGFDDAYFTREDQEYAQADFHCVASTVVQSQLIAAGVPSDRIWVVPYSADEQTFRPSAAGAVREPLSIVFAGQLTQRKGLRVLFAAVKELHASRPVTLDLYGPERADIRPDLDPIRHEPWLRINPPVNQDQLAGIFQRASVLVLPSWEEGFGLVVPQALRCGLPCVVSDRVGAQDLIKPRANGSVFPAGDASTLAHEIDWWLQHPGAFHGVPPSWEDCAGDLLRQCERRAGP